MVKKAAQATPNHLLRMARQERGWNQQDVADRIGAPHSLNISRWESGTAFPRAYYIQQLCLLFEKTANELGLIPSRETRIHHKVSLVLGNAPTTNMSTETPSASSPTPLNISEMPSTDVGELERRIVTILFCDLVGFTNMVERLDPEDVREIQGLYFGHMSKEIQRFGGVIEKYAGDSVLALFGIPIAHEDDAERAVRCGLSMQTTIKEVAVMVRNRWMVEFVLRVGINTGEVVSGIWDTGNRKDFAVSGDAVNIAALLQSVAEPGEVLVGEETMWLARRDIHFGEQRTVVPRGKTEGILVYPVIEERQRPHGGKERGQRLSLVGRTNELTLLSSIWAKVVQEIHPHLITVLGEAGIGKSRLIAEYEDSLLNEARILHGRCLPYGEALGYWALANVLKEAAAITVADSVEMASRKLSEMVAGVIGQAEAEWDTEEITHHLALLCGLDGESDRPTLPVDQRTLHMSVCRFIEALAVSQPMCIMFEDLHWADDALLDLIEFIAMRVRDVPLLIVVQARPELLEKRPTWCRGLRNFTSLSVESLDDRHGHDLALMLCQERGISAELVDQVAHRAAGNPLFAEELVATFAERGETTGIPLAIKALILTRLDMLPPQERRALQLAAVIGKVFWQGGLHALGAVGTIAEPLEALLEKALLQNHFRSLMRGEREYAFKHDLIRDVAYEMLSRADRRLLHSRTVTWLETISGERIEEYLDLLAHHAVQADQPEHALDYLIRAAERAHRAAAHRKECRLLAQAIEIVETTDNQQLSAMLHAKRGRAFRAIAMWTEADRELKIALSSLAPEQHEQHFQVLMDLVEVRQWLIDTPGTRQYATEALRRAQLVGRDDFIASAMGALAYAEGNEGAVHACLNHYQEAFVRTGKNLPTPLFWFEQYGVTLYWTGNYEAAIERSREAIEGARKSYDTTTIARALGNLGIALTGRGRYDEALQVFAETRKFAREYDTGAWLARAIAMCGGLHLQLFDFTRAEALAEEAREISRSVNWPHATASAGIDLLMIYAHRQELGRAEVLLTEVAETVAVAQGAHGWNWALRLAETRAEIALARGEWGAALSFADDAIAQSLLRGRVKYQVAGLVTRAKALTSLGRKHEAIACLRNAIKLARPIGDPAMILRAEVALLTLEGDDALLVEARTTAQRIVGAVHDEEIIRCFTTAEHVRVLGLLTP